MHLAGDSIRVLHVDDRRDVADTAATHLEHEDDRFVVDTATSAAEGLDRITGEAYDCVVSDYDMPGLDGVEFLERVREDHPDLPSILFTATGSETVAAAAISAGVTDYLRKQSATEQYAILANKVRNAVEAARDRQARHRHLEAIESAHEGIAILTESGEFDYVNEAYADLYGYDAAEMLGEHWTLIYPDEEVSVAREEILPTVRETGYWHGESTGLRADGTTFPEDHVVSETEHGDLVCTVRDLSDQRERAAELTLKNHAIETAPVGVTITDPRRPDNPVVYANETFEEITGYDSEAIRGRNCRFLQGENTDPERVAALREAIAAAEPVTVELRNYRKDGTEFWNRVKIAPIESDTGDVRRWIGFQEDVTERKQRERELAALFENAPLAIAYTEFCDGDPIVRDVNDAFERTFGYDTDTAVGRDLDELVVPGADQTEAAEINQDVRAGERFEVEVRRETSDGVHDFVLHSVPLRPGESGLRSYAIYHDVTERRRRERALERLHEATRDLMTATTTEAIARIGSETAAEVLDLPMNGIHRYDPSRGDLVPVAWSDETESFFDSAPPPLPVADSLAGRSYEAGESRMYADVQQVEGHHNPDTDIRSELYVPIGEYGMLIAGSPSADDFDATDEALAQVLATNVESALDRVEREEELQRQNERLDDFASVVSHDLRNPLNVAQGRLDLAEAAGDQEHVAEAADAVDRSLSMIDDLLTLAREGEQVSEVEAVSLGDTADSCWANVATHDASLVVETARTIQADPNRLKHLLENLMRNAVEHGDETVTVTVGDCQGGFYVADDGPGIPEDNRERVFETGYSTKDGGTGFGLNMVQQIAEAHGWAVTATASDAGGARFEITGVEVS